RDFRVTVKDMERLEKDLSGNLTVPGNFEITVPVYNSANLFRLMNLLKLINNGFMFTDPNSVYLKNEYKCKTS
ncbi:hypothetical protein ACJMK2_014947, partial [Sinanodonta woodiana]